MKILDLIGKKISDIKVNITDFEYDGKIPLEKSNSFIVLESGEFVIIPNKFSVPNNNVDIFGGNTDNHYSVFEDNYESKFIKWINRFLPESENSKIIRLNKLNIQNKEITGIYIQNEDTDSRELENYVLEIDNHYLISEIKLYPKGAGNTGIWVFKSKEDLFDKFGGDFKQL